MVGVLITALIILSSLACTGVYASTAALHGLCVQTTPANCYKLIYFDGHMHTVESDGTGILDDVKIAAKERGLSAVIVTNHDNELTLAEWKSLNKRVHQLSDDGFLMINGFEVTGSEGLFNRDHVLAWNASDPFVGPDYMELAADEIWESPVNPYGTGPLYPENITKWVNFIHWQGGIAVHAHTTGSTNLAYGVDAIELFNLGYIKDVTLYASMLGLPIDQAWGLGVTMNNMAIYGERDLSLMVSLPAFPYPLPLRDALYLATMNMTGIGLVFGAPEAPQYSWDYFLMAYVNGEINHPIFGVANTDAHNTGNLTDTGDYSDVGEAKNGVFVRGKLTKGTLFAAVRAGRSFATTGPSMSFTVNDKMMGETVRAKRKCDRSVKLKLSVNAESPTAVIGRVTVIKNASVWKTLAPMTGSYNATTLDIVGEDGYYRVEVISVDLATGQYQFAYSNPVFVDI
jgi:hypothetical protein